MAGERDRAPIESNPECAKCGGATELLSYVARFGDRPALHFFECTVCKAVEWKTDVGHGSRKSDLSKSGPET